MSVTITQKNTSASARLRVWLPGIESIFMLAPDHQCARTYIVDDSFAIFSDWLTVGQDMRHSMDRIHGQILQDTQQKPS